MNVTRIKNILTKTIAKAPTTIVLKRNTETISGIGSVGISSPSTVATFEGILNSALKTKSGDKIEHKPILIIAYTNTFTPKIDDFFTVLDVEYKIINIPNILNQNIFWQCELEVIRYG